VADRKLGRGLEALLGRSSVPVGDATAGAEPVAPVGHDIVQVPPDDIRPNPFQPRKDLPDESIRSLAESIERHGVLQPVIVRQTETGYELVAGERRWRAAMHLGLAVVPALVRDADDTEMLLVALIENVQREDLNPIDRARAYRQLCDEFGLTQERAAAQLGIDRASLANYMRLLDLPQDVQDLVSSGRLSMGHARAILSVRGEERRRALARRAAAEGLSVRRVEELAGQAAGPVRKSRRRTADPHIRSLEERLMERLGTRVVIRSGRKKHSGRIVIEFYSNDDFERIFEAVVQGDVPRGTSVGKGDSAYM